MSRILRLVSALPAGTRIEEVNVAGSDTLSRDVIASITGHDRATMVAHYTEQKRKAQIAALTLRPPALGNSRRPKA